MGAPSAAGPQAARTEQIILFRISGQLFAISSSSVREVRSVDTMAGMAREIPQTSVRKVRHIVWREDDFLYVVNGAIHFGLPVSAPGLLFALRNTKTALLVDGLEKMTVMTRLNALPRSFCREERLWYRGLTLLEQTVIPVVNPEGFLTQEELLLLNAAVAPIHAPAVWRKESESVAP